MPNIVELIKKASLQALNESMPAGVFFGTVTNSSPLKINIEQRLTLDSSHLVLTSLVSTFNMETSMGDIEVNLGLSVGEKVILLRSQGGQKYIVLDRVR